MTSLDMNLINDLRELMEDEFGELVAIYLRDSSTRFDQIKAAVAAANSTDIRHTAHSLKGSSSNIGAVELTSLCQQLEEMGKDSQLAKTQELVQRIESELNRVQTDLRGLLA